MHSLGYLLHAYNVSKTTFFRRRDTFTNPKPTMVQGRGHNKGMTAIDNRAIAMEWYTPRFFYAREKAMSTDILRNDKGEPLDGWETYQRRFGHWGKDWDEQTLSITFEQANYQRMAREHDARQVFIQEELLDALKHNVCTSYRQLAKHINGWCASATIETWLKTHPTYHLYAKNIKPGLTEDNRAKQVAFSRRVHNLWGLDREENKKFYGFLIGAHRCAAFQVPHRDIYFSSKDPVTGRTVFKGN